MVGFLAKRLTGFVFMNRTLHAGIAVIIVLLPCCLSCDTGFRMPFRRYNLSWSRSPKEGYDYCSKSWYYASPGGPLAILHWEGSGQLSAEAATIILCLKRTHKQSTSAYHLTKGVFVRRCVEEITLVQLLDEDCFSSELLSKQCIRLSYKGRVLNEIASEHAYEPLHLQFCVTAKENARRVTAIVRELYPQLKEREQTREIAPYVEPLLAGK